LGVNSIFPDNYKKVLDNYAVKIGRAKRKAPAGKSAGVNLIIILELSVLCKPYVNIARIHNQ
jgi:hypothetical protein